MGRNSSETLQLGMVGLGGWGKNLVRSFSMVKRCNLAVLCDADDRLLQHYQRLYPQSEITTSYKEVLESPVDAVALATPAPLHYEMAKSALLAGKHVYVEKPMTLRSAHAEELIRLAEERDLRLMVGHLLEYHPAVQLMKQQVDSGSLGEIHYMYCQRLNLGVVRRDENAFWSLAPHDISVILYLFGSEPDRVTATGESYLQPGVEDVVFAQLHFSGGRMAQIHVSWLDPHKDRRMVIVGSQKMLVFNDMEASEKIRIYDKGAACPEASTGAAQAVQVRHGDIWIPNLEPKEPLALEVQHFVDSVLDHTTPRSDGWDGLRVVRILEQVDQQLRSAHPGTSPMP